MRRRATFAAVVAGLSLLAVACGGPEGARDDLYAADDAALTAPGPANAPAAPATSSGAAAGTATTVSAARSARVAGQNGNLALQPVGYLVAGDSSPDPIPAQPKKSLGPAPAGLDCDAYPDLNDRLACHLLTGR